MFRIYESFCILLRPYLTPCRWPCFKILQTLLFILHDKLYKLLNSYHSFAFGILFYIQTTLEPFLLIYVLFKTVFFIEMFSFHPKSYYKPTVSASRLRGLYMMLDNVDMTVWFLDICRLKTIWSWWWYINI